MNVGFLSIHPQNESLGTINRLKGLCQSLSKLGYSVFVFSPYEFKGDWGETTTFHQIPGLTGKSKIATKIYKIVRWVLKLSFISRQLILRKKTIETLISQLSHGLLKYLQSNPQIRLDFIIGEIEVASLVLCRSKQELKIPIIADYHNYWPEELIVSGVLKRNNNQHNYLLNLEREILRDADHIITVSDFLSNYLIREFQIAPDKFTVVMCGGWPSKDTPEKREFPPRIIYSGLVAPRANVELFVKAIPFLSKSMPELKFYITKKGEHLSRIQKLAKQLNVNPEFYWFENYQDFATFLTKCSVGILTSSQDLPAKFGPATKMFDYLTAGVPIVGDNIGSWTENLKNKKVALMTSDDPQELASAILSFLKDSKLADEYAQRGIDLVKNEYNWVNIVQNNLIPILDKLKKNE